MYNKLIEKVIEINLYIYGFDIFVIACKLVLINKL